MTTLDILEEILYKNPEIKFLTFHKFPKQELLQNRIIFGDIECKQFDEALKIREQYHLPFWDSIMLTYFNKTDTSTSILQAAMVHHSKIDKIETMDIQMIKNLIVSNPTENYALNSSIVLKNDVRYHLPLLDFHIPSNLNNLIQVKKVLFLLDLHQGYILDSGESYHYIGINLLNEDALINFLSKALLFSPIIDRAWISHQLLERSCSLRVSNKNNKTTNLIHRIHE